MATGTGEKIAHGLDGQPAQPDFPPLTLAEADELLRLYPACGGAEKVLTASPRPFSSASLVQTTRGPVFVKRVPRLVRSAAELREEHRFIAHLRASGARVPEVLAAGSGETTIERGDWTYEVQARAEGIDLYADAPSWTPFRNTEHACAAGSALAHLHSAAESFDTPARSTPTLTSSFDLLAAEDLVQAAVDFASTRPELARYLEFQPDWKLALGRAATPLHARLKPYLGDLAPLWTHNDLHGSNLLWSGAGAEVATVIDFGLANRTNAVYDLATAIERNAIEWLSLERPFDEVVHLDQVDALLDGYRRVRALSAAERRALPAMLPIVHVGFALSEADFFLRVLGSREKADLAWHGFLLGHAEWFAGPNGAALLQHLAEHHVRT